jgi:arsenate reductase-like glutaredoxin family protein
VLRLPESAKTLELVGNKITFRDLRAEPLAEAELEELLVELGDRLADRTTNDYRTLKTWLKTLK